jgi:hypothetical protein
MFHDVLWVVESTVQKLSWMLDRYSLPDANSGIAHTVTHYIVYYATHALSYCVCRCMFSYFLLLLQFMQCLVKGTRLYCML